MTTSDETSAPVRLAIIGTGGIGRLHVTLAAASASIALVGLSSLEPDAETLAREVGVPLARDYRDVLAYEPEAVRPDRCSSTSFTRLISSE